MDLDRIEAGKGCENCGKPVVATNKYGLKHCGQRTCKSALAQVGVSRVTSQWFRDRNSRIK